MLKQYSKAISSTFLTSLLICLAILAVRYIAISIAEASDLNKTNSAVAKQTSSPAPIAEALGRLNGADTPAIPTRHFEPFWLLALGATLLSIGASIKYIARTAAKAPLTEGKTKRAL